MEKVTRSDVDAAGLDVYAAYIDYNDNAGNSRLAPELAEKFNKEKARFLALKTQYEAQT